MNQQRLRTKQLRRQSSPLAIKVQAIAKELFPFFLGFLFAAGAIYFGYALSALLG